MSGSEQVLGRRHLYMLPTGHGLLFAMVLLAILLGAVNYGNGLAYALSFLLGSLGLVSMLHTHRNLSGLKIRAAGCAPVFAGQTARFELWLHNPGPRPRYGVQLEQARRVAACVDIPAGDAVRVSLEVPAPRRGHLACPPVVIASRFPLSLLRSWSRRFTVELECLVYPRPGEPDWPWQAATDNDASGRGRGTQADDFAGLRPFQRGDSPQHVSWKAVARGQGMLTKQFDGSGQLRGLWLDWDQLAGLDTETRLERLCRAVLDAEQAGLDYGLRLPGTILAPDRGEAHRQHCLAALAVFDEPGAAA